MSIFSRLLQPNISQADIQTRSNEPSTDEATILDAITNGRYSNSGSVMSISAVFAGIELIANSVAELPIVIKRDYEIDKNHPVNLALESTLMNKFNLMKQIVQDMIIYGDSVVYIERSKGIPIKLSYCEHGTFNINYNQTKQEISYNINGKGKVSPEDVLHFYKNSQDGVVGKSVISYAKKIFDLAKYTDTAATDYYASGCNLNGILTVAGNPSPVEIEKIRMNWKRLHSGEGSSGLAILKQNMKYESIGSSAADSQLLEARLFNVSEVARFLNINPVLLGDLSKSSYNTIEAANLEFVTHTLLPYISILENELNRKLLSPDERKIYKIDLEENYLLRVDKASTADYLNTLVSSGILSVNEARAQLGFAPIEGGDRHIIAYTDLTQNTLENNSEE